MEWIVLVIGMAFAFGWFVYRWQIRKNGERVEFKMGESRRLAAKISKNLGATKERKPHFIRINGARPFSKLSLTPKEYGEYLLRKGVKKWGRNK